MTLNKSSRSGSPPLTYPELSATPSDGVGGGSAAISTVTGTGSAPAVPSRNALGLVVQHQSQLTNFGSPYGTIGSYGGYGGGYGGSGYGSGYGTSPGYSGYSGLGSYGGYGGNYGMNSYSRFGAGAGYGQPMEDQNLLRHTIESGSQRTHPSF
jgi:peroxin-13